MSIMLSMAIGVWNKFWIYIVAGAGILLAYFSWAARMKGVGKRQAREHMRKQINEQVDRGNKAAASAAGVDLDEWLRNNAVR